MAESLPKSERDLKRKILARGARSPDREARLIRSVRYLGFVTFNCTSTYGDKLLRI